MAQRIAEFNAPLDQAAPTGAGAEAQFRAGRIIEMNSRMAAGDVRQLGGEVGQAVDQHLTQEDVLQSGVQVNQRTIQLHDDLNAAAQRGEDLSNPQVMAKYQDKYGQDIQTIADNNSRTDASRLHVGELANSAKAHGYELTSGVMAQASQEKAVSSLTELTNTASNLAARNFASVPQQLAQIDQSIQTISSNPGLNAEGVGHIKAMGDKMKSAVVTAGIDGLIANNPDAAAAVMHNLPPEISKYVNGAEVATKISQAQKLDRSIQMQARALANENNRIAAAQASNQMTARIWEARTPEEVQALRPDAIQVGSMPGAPPGMTESFQAQIERRTAVLVHGKDVTTDPETFTKFQSQVGTPDFNVMQINNARGVSLNSAQADELIRMNTEVYSDPAFRQAHEQLQQFVNDWKPLFTKSTSLLPGTDPSGDIAFQDFQNQMTNQFFQNYRAGIKPADMFNRQGGHFLGNGVDPTAMRKAAVLYRQQQHLQTPAETGATPPPGATLPNYQEWSKSHPDATIADWAKVLSGEK